MLHGQGVENSRLPGTQKLFTLALAATEKTMRRNISRQSFCKVVGGIDEAISHINHYSSQHTDTIVTENHANAMRFLPWVDSASVMINAVNSACRWIWAFGLGAEIGISTDKFHARGPVGLEGLTSQKWIVFGNGEVGA